MKTTELTQEQKRIKIAEACGWTLHKYGDSGNMKGWLGPNLMHRESVWRTYFTDDELPDYFNDLKACHEAEKVLNEAQIRIYCSELLLQNYPWNAVSADAEQRAEAFGKTLGLW